MPRRGPWLPKFDETVLVRDARAEVVGGDPVGVKLLADDSATGGALSTVRVTLAEGADGARPHRHDNSAEMFFVLDGTAELLSGDDVVTAERGDLVVVPPGRPHAPKLSTSLEQGGPPSPPPPAAGPTSSSSSPRASSASRTSATSSASAWARPPRRACWRCRICTTTTS